MIYGLFIGDALSGGIAAVEDSGEAGFDHGEGAPKGLDYTKPTEPPIITMVFVKPPLTFSYPEADTGIAVNSIVLSSYTSGSTPSYKI